MAQPLVRIPPWRMLHKPVCRGVIVAVCGLFGTAFKIGRDHIKQAHPPKNAVFRVEHRDTIWVKATGAGRERLVELGKDQTGRGERVCVERVSRVRQVQVQVL